MFVKSMYGKNQEYRDPSWDLIDQVIRSLDGSSLTDVFLDPEYLQVPEPKDYMAISGGNEGRYQIVIQDSTDGNYYLSNPKKGRDDVMVMVGGLDEYCPAEFVHDLETVLLAAKTYAQTGERDTRLKWKRVGRKGGYPD